ncbi:MAG: TetR family transcriptional regulator [Planococcaceae bacterium]|nr:TetR family transcriptional regulator [Planococcaceae bacterium]
MPKQTFFNLPIEKRDSLISAAMKEFSRVPLSEASIANIIKDAAIPRGSFYQYFEDKEDIFYFLLEEYSSTLNQRFRSILVKEDGDLIPTFIESYRMMLESIQNKEFRYFFKNAFLNMNYRIENTISKSISEEKRNSRFAEVAKLVNMDLLNIQHESELFHVVKIIRAVTFQNLIQVFALELSMEESIKNYTLDLHLIKNGVYKK